MPTQWMKVNKVENQRKCTMFEIHTVMKMKMKIKHNDDDDDELMGEKNIEYPTQTICLKSNQLFMYNRWYAKLFTHGFKYGSIIFSWNNGPAPVKPNNNVNMI